MIRLGALWVAGLLALWTPCRAAAPATPEATPCAPADGLSVICGVQKPEDIVPGPGARWAVASSMVPGGGLWLVDTRTKSLRRLPMAAPRPDHRRFAACPGRMDATAVVLHGLSLRRHRLYAVSHGPREAVEVFELDTRGASPSAAWVGCLPLPQGMRGNSVTSFADGAVAVTVPLLPGMTLADSIAGKSTGAVLLWPAGGRAFAVLPGTGMVFNNGIEAASAGDEFFVVATSGREVAAFSRRGPAGPRRSARLGDLRPDNIHWMADGRLIAAGRVKTAGGQDEAASAYGWAVVAIDPATLAVTPLAQGGPSPAIFGVSSAMTFGDEIWLGSYGADRIAWLRRP